MAKSRRQDYHLPQRLHFAADEAVHPWLPPLLDAYFIVDRGVAEALKQELRRGRKPVCAKGCAACCKTHTTIPVYPLELVGLSWFVIEKLKGPVREAVRVGLSEYREDDPCPFLIEGACGIHPMRPVSCRQFIVFNYPCEEKEDPYYTRREDVLTPIRKYTDRAFFAMLPFYGIHGERERWSIIESGKVHQVVKLMQTCNWRSLAGKMSEFDASSLSVPAREP